MRNASFLGMVVGAVIVAGAVAGGTAVARAAGLGLPQVPVLEVVTGALCLVWLLVILKYPWDIYFEARAARGEAQRSVEAGIAVPSARLEEIGRLVPRVLILALGTHLASALLLGAISHFSRGQVSHWFAVFYLVSTVFRPAASGYRHLRERIRALASAVRFPREDVLTLRCTVERHTEDLTVERARALALEAALLAERSARETGERATREQLAALGREFESTLARLTDNQDVIRGIQAFVRLIGRADA